MPCGENHFAGVVIIMRPLIIKFILSHADEVDFTDGNGKLKRCFLPEELLSTVSVPEGEKATV
jgi:hypothetical protein